MRELPGETRPDNADAAADGLVRSPADDAPRREPVFDSATRTALALEYRKKVDAVYAACTAEQQNAEPPDVPPETEARDGESRSAMAEVDKRSLPRPDQAKDVSAHEKRRWSDKDITYWAMFGGFVVNTAAEHLSVIPHSLAADISGGLTLLAAGLVLRREKHREDKHADRPED
jgi:hypothetical protein